MEILTKYGLTQADIDKFKQECIDDIYNSFDWEHFRSKDYEYVTDDVMIFLTVDIYFSIYKTDDIYCNPDAIEHDITLIEIAELTIYDAENNDCHDLIEFLMPQLQATFAI